MTRRPRGRTGPFESNIETALAPGRYVSHNANYDFVRGLEFVEQQLQGLIPTESIPAIALYETFLAGCYEKAEGIDDSSASLGQFVDDLSRGWIISRQAAGADPDETATRLLPDLAARLWRAQGMRIVNARKSKSYDAALANFESVERCFERCFERAGLTTEWEKTVSQVRGAHHRKTGFMSGFERLVAGSGPSDAPSFLQRAKARWSGRQRRER
jgi:hypothetical protein